MRKTLLIWLMPVSYLFLILFWFSPEIVMGLFSIRETVIAAIVFCLRWFFFLSTLALLFINLKLYSKTTWRKFFYKIKVERSSILFLTVCTTIIIAIWIPKFRIIEGLLDSDIVQPNLYAFKMIKEKINPPIFTGEPSHIGSVEAHLIFFLMQLGFQSIVICVLPTFIFYLIFYWIFFYLIRQILGTGTAVITAILLIFPSEAIQKRWIYANSNAIPWLLLATITIYLTKHIIENQRDNFRYWGTLGFLCGFAFWQREISIATTFICILYLFRQKPYIDFLKKILIFIMMFMIGFLPIIFYYIQKGWSDSFLFLSNNIKEKKDIFISFSSYLKKIDILLYALNDYLFDFEYNTGFLVEKSNILERFFFTVFIVFLLLFILYHKDDIKDFFIKTKIHKVSAEIFLLFFFITVFQTLFIPTYGKYTPPLVLRYYYPGVIFLFPVFGEIIFRLFQKSKIFAIIVILLFLGMHIPCSLNYYQSFKVRYTDIKEFEKFAAEKNVTTVHTGYWFSNLARMITYGRYKFDSSIGPYELKGIELTYNNQERDKEIIVATDEARDYVKKTFLVMRTPYKILELNTFDIYYDYPEDFVKILQSSASQLILGQDLLDFNKPLKLAIECKEGEIVALDAVLMKRQWFEKIKVQIDIITPKNKIIKIPDDDFIVSFPENSWRFNIKLYSVALNLKFDNSIPNYDGPGTYKVLPLLMDVNTDELLNSPVTTSIIVGK
ncbi:glycosyltransferase family 39 protein [bacterium]|nr:glycosyltransferase family 39 protein [bacterium]